MMQSIATTGSNVTAGEVFVDGTSKASGQLAGASISSDAYDWGLLAANYSSRHGFSQHHVNFAFAGTELTSVADFNTDTATFLAAI